MTIANPDPPILEGEPLSASDERLIKTFDELETKQLDFLDQAAKRVVELVSILFGTLLAVFSLGDKFPPANFAEAGNRLLGSVALAAYVLALVVGAITMFPRTYQRYEFNLTLMRKELNRLVAFKLWTVRVSGGLFIIGTLILALLLARIILA